ncbi:NADH dehydrogenase [Pseudoxanthomonas sp. 3HH-4]|uniref:NAD(P)/FAD-dependent oxidoreductase n=1 Tax=Pseudoxanthomonas sp. 3HH-4 TaxID=1690214 RepID=UPI0011521ADA|nr:NAD(P)/FAD-dependent oxidoreductase [Pseudoxanthomonas sp. 3HH-4]TQM12289.1 NADH dehydrogenase [Pseudoxanthomonas sp. 3HH-4]
MHRVVVVGGGAGGLELATQLGNAYCRGRKAKKVGVTLVDPEPFHVWKPLLHEVASGSLDPGIHQVDYAAQGYWHGFDFAQGAMTGLDRSRKLVKVGAVFDTHGQPLFPARALPYETLVIAVGSTTNFFDIPGAREHSFALDTVEDAERFRSNLVSACIRADSAQEGAKRRVRIVIVGGGATGVELAAELRQTARFLSVYGLHHLDPMRDIHISIVEAGPRILPTLPERVSEAASELLERYSVQLALREQVKTVTAQGLFTSDITFHGADLIVWAAGIKALPLLSKLDGLAVGERGQLLVKQTLQSVNDDTIFALGDCAQCHWSGQAQWVPPRAQAAHQQVQFLLRALGIRLKDPHERLPLFRYRDLGSLVSLGRLGATGNLMGGLISGRLFVDGILARIMYRSLYRMHCVALHGWWRTGVDMLANLLRRSISTKIKLH